MPGKVSDGTAAVQRIDARTPYELYLAKQVARAEADNHLLAEILGAEILKLKARAALDAKEVTRLHRRVGQLQRWRPAK